MKIKITSLLGLLMACSSAFSTPASNLIWQDVQDDNRLQYRAFNTDNHALKTRSLNLNEGLLRDVLLSNTINPALSAKSATSVEAKKEIALPLPNGGFVRVVVIDSPILSAEESKNHPEIKTWRVVGVDSPAITGRLDFTSQGFHGMLILEDGDTIFIDPDKDHADNLYHSLSKRDNASHFETNFDCKVHDDHAVLSKLGKNLQARTRAHDESIFSKKLANKKLAQIPVPDLITYRLAIAGTAEYTASQGGTKASAYASMVTTINRVNEIYRRDLGVTLQLVSGEQFLYTNASTDPYTNDNASALVDENMDNLFNNFDGSKYDIGHVFAQGPLGGLAYVGVACLNTVNTPSGIVNGLMAGGATGVPSPQGEIFSVSYVAHEIGHQLGATHTFNGTKGACTNSRTQETAVEPGSGSTIMAYAGICGSDNIQFRADAMFHQASITQIRDYTRADHGAACAKLSSSGGQNPVANAGENIKIPLLTPFILEGTATGGSTYTWDQMDAGSASAVDVDTGNNALIRAELPSSNPNRYIPRLTDLFGSTTTLGEKLSQTVRALNFAFVVRNGNGGVDHAIKTVSVNDTGGLFKVLSQTTAKTFSTGESVDIAWQVAGTNNAPVSCNKVDIKLLRDSGVENVLIANTDNDGEQTLVVPASTPVMTNARVMVVCSNRSFFQISSGAIAVQKGTGDLVAPVITINGSTSITINKGTSYTDAGATAVDNIDGAVNVVSSGTVNSAVVGTYTITYTAKDATKNTATAIRTIIVKPLSTTADTTAPSITLIGSSIINLKLNDTYVDQGATASDNIDSIVSVTTSGSVNTGALGTYTISYTATDTAGNTATKTRMVKVVEEIKADKKAPVITLKGEETITLEVDQKYQEPGFSAFDKNDGIINVVVTGKVDTSKAGTYVLTYTATDVAGNTLKKVRTIIVVKKDNGGKTDLKSSGGGSIIFILLPLGLIGLRRRFLK